MPGGGTFRRALGSVAIPGAFDQVNGNGPRELQASSSDDRFSAVAPEMVDGWASVRQGLRVFAVVRRRWLTCERYHDARAVRGEPAFACLEPR